MKKTLLFISFLFLLISCENTTTHAVINVKNIIELNEVLEKVMPGDEIILANGIWKDAQIDFYGLGTQEQPITLRAETPGKVFIEGESYIHLGGKHLIVDGLYFRNGHSPKTAIIRYMIGKDSTAFNSSVTNTVIEIAFFKISII